MQHGTKKKISQVSTTAAPSISFPAYGVINADNTRYLSTYPIALNFRLDSTSNIGDYSDWTQWINSMGQDMSTWLWPIFQYPDWAGRDPVSCAQLSRADLDLMLSLQAKFGQIIDGDGKNPGLHKTAFSEEDVKAPGASFVYYRSDFPSQLLDRFNKAVIKGGMDIARPASQALKRLFQRPRPAQIALLLNAVKLEVQPSASAITPSMVSGHCLQSSMAICTVEQEMGDELKRYPNLLADVQRYLIDVGDRRVLAGLHYPSDNVSSWYVCLKLCDHIFPYKADELKRSLWSAIERHSMVYKAMLAHYDPGIYSPMIVKLKQAASVA